MASAVTIDSSKIEGQLFLIIESIINFQNDPERNPDGIALITGYSRNMDNGIVSGSFTLPTNDIIEGGKLSLEATEVFVDATTGTPEP